MKAHGSTLFQPFDKEVLRVSPLKWVHPSATFRMQPRRFIRDGVLKPLKTMLDQYVSEGVLIPDSSCNFASPLVIVDKKNVEFVPSGSKYAAGDNGKSIAISA